jgi:hypothetical protein
MSNKGRSPELTFTVSVATIKLIMSIDIKDLKRSGYIYYLLLIE